VPGGFFIFHLATLMAAFAGMTAPFSRPYFAAKTRLADRSQTSRESISSACEGGRISQGRTQ
jgi:hypothetical protein